MTWLSGNCSHGRQMVCRISSLSINSLWLPQLFSQHCTKSSMEKKEVGRRLGTRLSHHILIDTFMNSHSHNLYLLVVCPNYYMHTLVWPPSSAFYSAHKFWWQHNIYMHISIHLQTFWSAHYYNIKIIVNLKLQWSKCATHKTKYWHHRKL